MNPVGERGGAGTRTRRGVPASRIACPSGRRTVPAEDHSDLRPERKPAGGLPPPVPVEPARLFPSDDTTGVRAGARRRYPVAGAAEATATRRRAYRGRRDRRIRHHHARLRPRPSRSAHGGRAPPARRGAPRGRRPRPARHDTNSSNTAITINIMPLYIPNLVLSSGSSP